MSGKKFSARLKDNAKKVKNVKWLLPGWVFYEYYKLHKNKGHNVKKSFGHGMKAEAIRLAAMASIPVPGTYELTTSGLALIKKKIENGEVEKLTLKAFRDFMPIRREKKLEISRLGKSYLRVFYKDRKLYFEIFYKEK